MSRNFSSYQNFSNSFAFSLLQLTEAIADTILGVKPYMTIEIMMRLSNHFT